MSTPADPSEDTVGASVTRLLIELQQGSRDAFDALVPLVYDELLAIAHRQRVRWRDDHTLGTTALVHEAYCKLVNQDRLVAENRAHFFALASRAMRHILCNYARDRRALKRGGGHARVDLDRDGDPPASDARLDDDTDTATENAGRLLALNAALSRLEQINQRRSRVVECRFFGGMTVADTAAALQVSERTVKRDWAAAQEWLRREIAGDERSDEATSRTLDALAADVLPPLMAALAQASPDALRPGQRVASYEIVAPLGHGGMGIVYRAYDTRLDRHVALKFLPSHRASDAAARARLADEARAASALDHPNICTIYDIGALDDGRTFLALACYEGRTLKERIAAGPLPVAEAVAIARQVAEGLAAAHRRGIVHRDIKPSNVMLTTDGTVKILDFGIAKVRDRDGTYGSTAGTIAYMSPEHARGEPIDGRSDLWSLGVVIFEMLTGKRPFAGDTDARMTGTNLTQPVPLPALRADLPPLLMRVVETCLQQERDARYADADALLADLRGVDTETGAAYTLYLKGRYFWNKRDSASVQQARTYFEQALDLDPVLAPAWAGLADAFCTLGSYALLPPEDAYPRARAAAERALAIDDALPEAHASLATILADYYWSWDDAGAHYRRAIELNPGYATARLWYAGLLRDLGRFDAALVQVRAARELDPLSAPTHAAEGITLYLARRYAEAIVVYRRLLEIVPSYHYANFLMALACVQQGDHAGALRALKEAEHWTGADAGVRALHGFIHAAHGRSAEARAMLTALERDADQPHATSFQRAVIHAAIGEADRALALLTETCEARSKQIRLLRTEPLLDSIREEPGFRALLERVGLSDDAVAHVLTP